MKQTIESRTKLVNKSIAINTAPRTLDFSLSDPLLNDPKNLKRIDGESLDGTCERACVRPTSPIGLSKSLDGEAGRSTDLFLLGESSSLLGEDGRILDDENGLCFGELLAWLGFGELLALLGVPEGHFAGLATFYEVS
jgi:hypothetical protein